MRLSTVYFSADFCGFQELPNFRLAMVCKHEYLCALVMKRRLICQDLHLNMTHRLGAGASKTKSAVMRLGEKCGVAQSCAYRWMVGETRPDWLHIPRITAFIDGAITANDFVPTDD